MSDPSTGRYNTQIEGYRVTHIGNINREWMSSIFKFNVRFSMPAWMQVQIFPCLRGRCLSIEPTAGKLVSSRDIASFLRLLDNSCEEALVASPASINSHRWGLGQLVMVVHMYIANARGSWERYNYPLAVWSESLHGWWNEQLLLSDSSRILYRSHAPSDAPRHTLQ